MKTKFFWIPVTILLTGLLAAWFFTAPRPVQAASQPAPAAQRTPMPWKETLVPVRETLAALPTADHQALQDLLAREKRALSNQQTRLTLSHTVASATQTYIDSQKSAGKDTTALESALTTFNQAIPQAEAANSAAGAMLAAPAGFDAAGQVTDAAAARQTVHSAGQSLRQAHLTLTQATLALREAVKTYRGK